MIGVAFFEFSTIIYMYIIILSLSSDQVTSDRVVWSGYFTKSAHYFVMEVFAAKHSFRMHVI